MKKLPAVLALDRRAVRRRFDERFTVDRMAKDYVSAYLLMLAPSISGDLDNETIMPIRKKAIKANGKLSHVD